MTHYLLPSETNYNLTKGPDELISYIGNQVPEFAIFLFIFIFLLVFIGGALAEYRRKASSDWIGWLNIAMFVTLTIAFVMSVTFDGFVTNVILIPMLVLQIAFFIILVVQKRSGY